LLLPLLSASWAQDVAALQRAIAASGAKWTAASNWVSKLSFAEQQALCGTAVEAPDPTVTAILVLPKAVDLPAVFDWRDNGGNWVSPVHALSRRRQGSVQ
jgi:hypothetical protein